MKPNVSTTHAVAVIYSASVVDRLTTNCFFEVHDTIPDPNMNTTPEVLRLLSKSPT